MKVKALVATLAMLALPVVSMAAPSWSVTSNGSSSAQIDLATTPGPVSLALTANLNTDGNVVSGWQHALKTDQPSLWNYGNPTVNVTAAGFANSDIVFGPPAAGSGMTNDSTGEVSVFVFSGGDRAAINGPAETFNVVSKAELPVGNYTFSIGDSGLGFFMANANSPDGIAFGQGSSFTLSVIRSVPEPASVLLLLAGLPFLRRRQTA